MAKLCKVFEHKPIPTEVDGIYVRDLTAKTIEERFGDLHAMFEKDPEGALVRVFTELLCDETGEAFEDCLTYDEITSTLSMRSIARIVNAIPAALQPGPESEKK